jgi:hypothetical protein
MATKRPTKIELVSKEGAAPALAKRSKSEPKISSTSEEFSGSRNTDEASEREAIARLAYSYWEARGGVGGSPEEDWLRAEAEFQRHRSAVA